MLQAKRHRRFVVETVLAIITGGLAVLTGQPLVVGADTHLAFRTG